MSAHSSIHEEIKEQKQKTKDMSAKGKLAYFWYYYKVHTIVTIAVIAVVIMFVHQYVTSRDYAFYATMINADYSLLQDNQWGSEFEQYAGIDTEEYQAYIDTSMVFTDDDTSEYALANMDKLLAMLQSGTIDVIIADTENFESYAQYEYLMNLEEVLPEEVLTKYQDYFYYTDAATFTDMDDDKIYNAEEIANPADYVIDHSDPSTMEKPVVVGIYLPKDNKIMATGCYDYLEENGVTYQGYQSEAILGIPVSSTRVETVLSFLEFIEE
ncbi:MAG: hypothetical protein J6B68_06050 [Lachnospiraceae bacterium]|nr:hypothetical protein [Lachnospiraceae bacterium]